MFTGIIEATGKVVSLDGSKLSISYENAAEPWQLGESVAINGTCLTVVEFSPNLVFDVSEETFDRTALGSLSVGSVVNVERAMRLGDRLGGHIVQGHVDTVGKLVNRVDDHEFSTFVWEVPQQGDRYLIDKGSITINGISLTVVRPENGRFETWIIPHTLQNTDLASKPVGDAVNIEYDVLAKHVEKLLAGTQK